MNEEPVLQKMGNPVEARIQRLESIAARQIEKSGLISKGLERNLKIAYSPEDFKKLEKANASLELVDLVNSNPVFRNLKNKDSNI